MGTFTSFPPLRRPQKTGTGGGSIFRRGSPGGRVEAAFEEVRAVGPEVVVEGVAVVVALVARRGGDHAEKAVPEALRHHRHGHHRREGDADDLRLGEEPEPEDEGEEPHQKRQPQDREDGGDRDGRLGNRVGLADDDGGVVRVEGGEHHAEDGRQKGPEVIPGTNLPLLSFFSVRMVVVTLFRIEQINIV